MYIYSANISYVYNMFYYTIVTIVTLTVLNIVL